MSESGVAADKFGLGHDPASGSPAQPSTSEVPRPWLGSYPPGVPATFEYTEVPLTRLLDDAARDFPDVAATWFERATISYSRLVALVDRLAAALADLGVGRATPVGLVLPNLPAVVVTLFASLRLGAIVVPLRPSEALERELEDSGCELVVCDGGVSARIAAMRLPQLRTVITTQVKDWLPFPRRLFGVRRRRFRHPLQLGDLLRRDDQTARQAPISPDDIAVISYGGRAGSRVELSHANLVASAFQARLWLADTQAGKERILLATAPAHLQGLTVGMLNGVLSAATLLLLPRPDVALALRIIAQQRPTLVSGLPALYTYLVEHPAAGSTDLSSIRAGLALGPLTGAVVHRFQALSGGRLRAGYAPAEALTLTHANPIYGRAVEGSVGLPVTDTVAAVVDASDPVRPVPAGQVGQLAVSGPQIACHHLGDAKRVLADGWLLTRDLAVVDEAGYFSIRARDALSGSPR